MSVTILITLKSLVDDCEYAITRSPSTKSIPAMCSVSTEVNLVDVVIVESENEPVVQTKLLAPIESSVDVMCHRSESTKKSSGVSESGTSIDSRLQFPSIALCKTPWSELLKSKTACPPFKTNSLPTF